LIYERAHDSDSLALAAGELAGAMGCAIRETDSLQKAGRPDPIILCGGGVVFGSEGGH